MDPDAFFKQHTWEYLAKEQVLTYTSRHEEKVKVTF